MGVREVLLGLLGWQLLAGCGDDDGGPGRVRPSGEPLTPAILQSSSCWLARAQELATCMNAGTPTEGQPELALSCTIMDDDVTCNVGTWTVTLEPPARHGDMAGTPTSWARQDRSLSMQNAATSCGSFEVRYPEPDCEEIVVMTASGRSESEFCSSVSRDVDTRYARLACSDGTVHTASGSEVVPIFSQVPRISGTSGSATSALMQIRGQTPALDFSCGYP